MSVIDRAAHERWLLELTQIPTAAGREQRVVEWIRRWCAERPHLALTVDGAGNLQIAAKEAGGGGASAPLYFTAHLDHPAFVFVGGAGDHAAVLEFRGGVMDDYFHEARVVIHDKSGGRHAATLAGESPRRVRDSMKCWLAELDDGKIDDLAVGDVATWLLPAAEIRDGVIYTHACDDLAAAAAALAAFDTLMEGSGREAEQRAGPGGRADHVRLLFTRAEEIGFVGAIAACKEGTMPRGSRVLALENSRSFEDSPIGGGPIVRVGDRLSVFSPELTGAVARRAEEIAGAPQPTASQKLAEAPKWKWQRKLMAGGACEATVFCAYGYEATCVCLPLGNYHNMADLAAVQAGTNTRAPAVGPEYVSVADYHGLVDLLVACGRKLPTAAPVKERIEKLWAEKAFVLSE